MSSLLPGKAATLSIGSGPQLAFGLQTEIDANIMAISSPDEIIADELIRLNDGSHPLSISLSEDLCFSRDLRLPDIPGLDIHSLASGASASLPFSTEEVVRAYSVGDKDDADVLAVTEFILKREYLEKILRITTNLGVPIKTVLVERPDSGTANFLDDPTVVLRRPVSWLRWAKIVLIVLLGFSIFAGANIYLNRYMDALRGKISAIEPEAVLIRAELSRVAAIDARSAALEARRSSGANLLSVLSHMTDAIGDDTYLTDFEVIGRSAEVSGLSADAASVFEAVDGVDVFDDVEFASATTNDRASGRERFSISFSIPGEER